MDDRTTSSIPESALWHESDSVSVASGQAAKPALYATHEESATKFQDAPEDEVVLVTRADPSAAFTQPERPVKIISCLGSLSDSAGNDGDFYVDEMTNMLYGPKRDGVWPEEGVKAAGLCKRTWIALTRPRVAPEPETGLMWCIRWIMLPVRLVKGMIAVRSDRDFERRKAA